MNGFIKDINFYTPKSKPIVTDGEVARQEIALLLNTVPSEKPFDSNYGVDIESFLFDFITTANANSLYFEIVNKIKTYVKSVSLDQGRSFVSPNASQDGYDMAFVFKLKNTNDDGTFYKVTKKVNKND